MRIKTITLAIVAAAVSSCTQTPELNTTPRNSTISDNSSQTPYSIHNFVQIFPKENSNPITLEGTLPNGEKIITQTQFEKLKNALVGSRQIVIESVRYHNCRSDPTFMVPKKNFVSFFSLVS
jgi:hypothetical protein